MNLPKWVESLDSTFYKSFGLKGFLRLLGKIIIVLDSSK